MTPEEIKAEFGRLEDKIKEREISIFRALKTLLEDLLQYREGKQEFPQAAVLGLVFAYLRRRGLVILLGGVIGACIAGVLGAAQIYLLFNQNAIIASQNQLIQTQNDLIEAQNRQVEAQTDANQLQAVSFLISSIDPKDEARSQIAIAQLAEYGTFGVPALARLLRTPKSGVSQLALEALFGQHQLHTPEQVVTTLVGWRHLRDFTPPLIKPMEHSWSERWKDITTSVEYLEGLASRFEKDQAFRQRMRELIEMKWFLRGELNLAPLFPPYRPQSPGEFFIILADIHLDAVREARQTARRLKLDKSGALGDEAVFSALLQQDSDFRTVYRWHAAVFDFCRTLAGHRRAYDSMDPASRAGWETWRQVQIAERQASFLSAEHELLMLFRKWLDLPQ